MVENNGRYRPATIKRNELKGTANIKEMMQRFRRLASERGIIYSDSPKIGIRTWTDESSIHLQNYIIEPGKY